MDTEYDVAVIGAGPGGYIAAIRAAQLGLKTLCIDAFKNDEGNPSLGGTCLNVGCIPSKALLQSSENFHSLQHDFAEHGIQSTNPTIDITKMIARKKGIVDKLTGGIKLLFEKNGITSLHGTAMLLGRENNQWQISIGGQHVCARNIIIATGSRPRELASAPVDNISILDNAGALALQSVPKRLCVIGAGVIGLELGSVWKRLGSQVTLLEAMPDFLPAADKRIAVEAKKSLINKTGLDIQLGAAVEHVERQGEELIITYHHQQESKQLTADKLIVAVGRVPNTEGLGTEKIGLEIDAHGFITVDELCKTNLPNIWAIGDVVRGPMLAHKAMEEGVLAAEQIAGQKVPPLLFNHIPWVIYTQPEIAWVGQTEEQLKKAGIKYKKGNGLFPANGRALAMGQGEGLVKVLTDANNDRVLGIHIVGPMASELINEAALAIAFDASSEDLIGTIHAHPSLSETLHEAALAANKRALHG